MFAPPVKAGAAKAARPVATREPQAPKGESGERQHPEIAAPAGTGPGATRDFSQVPVFPHGPSAAFQLPPHSPQLPIGSVDDALEHEADRIAEEVVRSPVAARAVPIAQQTNLQVSRRVAGQPPPLSSAAPGQSDAAPASVHRALASPGAPLAGPLRREMEQGLGHDFSKVRVHSDAPARESAQDVGAHAYTVGHHVVFGANEFAPSTPRGRRLLAHELTHVVQQSAAGARGSILQRDPKPARRQPDNKPAPPARDPLAEVQKILSSGSPVARLRAWLDAHPGDFAVAKQALLEKATTATAQNEWKNLGDLIGEVFARDPNPRDARDMLQKQVDASADKVWEQYAEGAKIVAIQQWIADSHERTRIMAKVTTAAQKADITKQLASLRTEAEGALKELRRQRAPLMQALERSLAALPLAQNGKFVPSAEQDLVTKKLLYFEHALAFAQKYRIDTYELFTSAKPEAEAVAEIARRDKQRDTAEATLKAARQKLDDAKKLTGAGAAAKVSAATTAVEKAQERKTAAAAARTKPGAAARAIKYREDPQEKPRVDADLASKSASARRLFEKHAQDANLTSFAGLIDDEAGLRIAWYSSTTLRDGFAGFPMEHVIRPLLLARNRMIAAPKGTGIDAATSPDTYQGHGWGQYDLNAPAGAKVNATEPREISLYPVLGGSQKAVYEWVGSSVETTFGQDPRQKEKDVLDKLAYGIFGRDRDFERKISEADVTVGGPPKGRSPEPGRLVAGLLYRSTVAGAPLEIEKELRELRDGLEVQLESSEEFKGLVVDDKQEILRETFDASSGDFGTASLLNRDAFVAAGSRGGIPGAALNAFNTSVTRILQDPDNVFTQQVFGFVHDRLVALRASGGAEAGHKGVLDWAGPMVSVLHHYRLKGGTEEAWIRVSYLHLREIAAKGGKESKDPIAVGKVGSAGNAISPHVHMSIAVFRAKPSWNTAPIDYIDPTDFFGMVPRSPFNPVMP